MPKDNSPVIDDDLDQALAVEGTGSDRNQAGAARPLRMTSEFVDKPPKPEEVPPTKPTPPQPPSPPPPPKKS